MELSSDTNLIVNLGTLIACGFFLRKLSAQISRFQKETEMQLRDHEKRIKEFESLDLDSRLTEIQTNLKRIMKKMDEKDSN